jgi:hypothetical protein
MPGGCAKTGVDTNPITDSNTSWKKFRFGVLLFRALSGGTVLKHGAAMQQPVNPKVSGRDYSNTRGGGRFRD